MGSVSEQIKVNSGIADTWLEYTSYMSRTGKVTIDVHILLNAVGTITKYNYLYQINEYFLGKYNPKIDETIAEIITTDSGCLTFNLNYCPPKQERAKTDLRGSIGSVVNKYEDFSNFLLPPLPTDSGGVMVKNMSVQEILKRLYNIFDFRKLS